MLAVRELLAQQKGRKLTKSEVEDIFEKKGLISKTRLKPEKIYLGSKKHGIDWKEGAATAKKTNIPQGKWGSIEDLEWASEKATTLNPNQFSEFLLPNNHKSIVYKPDGTIVKATHIWVRNNGTGTFHGYPLIK